MDEVDGPGPNGDLDGDAVINSADNCPSVKSVDLTDTDGDGEGDACDHDDDNDSYEDAQDNCPRAANTEQTDNDGDGVGDAGIAYPITIIIGLFGIGCSWAIILSIFVAVIIIIMIAGITLAITICIG